jgi:hypothetical protein
MDVAEIANHSMLSEAARALSLDTLNAQAGIAAGLLGIGGVRLYRAEDTAAAAAAIVLQVNHQLAMDASPGAAILQSETRGPISKTYRAGPGGGAPSRISPEAHDLAAPIRALRYGAIRSTRR